MIVLNKTIAVTIVSIITLCVSSVSAQDCKCCSEKHRAFDFWVGEWNVYDTSGNQVGKNTITRTQNGCVLQENWESKTMTGTSYNHFNQNDSLWHQTWIDNQGGSLYIQGDVKDGVMTMGTKMIQGKTGKYYNRITWTPMKDGSVIQKWDLLNSKDEVFQTLFIGKYVRKE